MIILAGLQSDLIAFVYIGGIIIGLSMLLRYLRQPYIVAYILAGVMLGKHGFGIITDQESMSHVGEFGLILLLFFIGMEISLPRLLQKWKVATFGTLAQIFASILMVGIIGWIFGLTINQVIFLGFVISLSSSAVVIKILQDLDEGDTLVGQNVISILLMQDILIVPMLLIVKYLGGEPPPTSEIILQVVGSILIVAIMVWIFRKPNFSLPFSKHFEEDHELQVFMAMSVCFGCALLTAFFGLSAALGAFLGGMIVHASKSTDWFHDSLHSFRVVFVSLFFISIGILIDIYFLFENWQIISLLVVAVFIGNHFINASIIHYFGRNWRESMYGGALLAQVGELSFVLVSTAFFLGVTTDFEYQLSIITISLTLLLSPIWIITTKKIIGKK